ncbi:MAG: class I SAM-dependent methyltransferase [Xanthomonadales bacterium]|nr:class I SAM-dependent methyltransferase [Xanthomonadales bacterium]
MTADRRDPALETLFLPFETGLLTWPAEGGAPAAKVLFMRARDGWPLRQQPRPGLICEQSFKPDAEALQRSGWTVAEAADSDMRYPLVLVLPPRQRDEARALFAQALQRCAPGGIVVACIANDEGAKSGEGDFKRLCGLDGNLTKHHCRVFWSRRDDASIDAALLAQWSTLDAERPILDGRFISRPGVFAWDRIDPASQLLAEHLPTDLRGRAADLGAGYGYLSVELLQRCPGIASLDVYEAEARALDLAKRNLAAAAARLPLRFLWQDVALGLSEQYDVIVTNPPFHAQQGAARPDIGRAFIAAAAAALVPGGRLWLVANRNLPYELELDANFGSVRIVTQQQGFKIIEAIKGAATTPQPATPAASSARKRRAPGRAAEARAWRGNA